MYFTIILQSNSAVVGIITGHVRGALDLDLPISFYDTAMSQMFKQ